MKKWGLFLLITIVISTLYCYKLGEEGVRARNEQYYIQSAITMIHSGDVLTPYYKLKVRPHKPILTYWLILASFKLFGLSVFAARLPFMLLGIGGPVLLFLMIKKHLGWRTASYSGIMLATMPLHFYFARLALTDMALEFLILVTLLVYIEIVHSSHKREFLTILFFVLSGLSVLVKGPVSLFFIVTIIILFAVCEKSTDSLKKLFSLTGILLCSLITVSWFGIMIYFHGWNFFPALLPLPEIHASVSSQPFWLYIPGMLFTNFPWSFYLFPALVMLLHRIRRREASSWRFEKLFWIWFAVTFFFFSFFMEKRLHYIITFTPAIAVVCALYFSSCENGNRRSSFLFRLTTGIVLFLYTMLNILGLFFTFNIALNGCKIPPLLLYSFCTAMVLSSFLYIKKWRPSWLVLFFSVILLLMFTAHLSELHSDKYNLSFRFRRIIKKECNGNPVILFFRFKNQTVLRLPPLLPETIESVKRFQKLWEKQEQIYAVAKQKDLPLLFPGKIQPYTICAYGKKWKTKMPGNIRALLQQDKITDTIVLIRKNKKS